MRVFARVAVGAVLFALASVGDAAAHDVSTPAGHAQEDFVVHDRATEGRLNRETKEKSAAKSAAATVTGSPGEIGQWGPVVDWPVVAVNAALLPNGKVLAYDSVGDKATETYPDQTFTRATVWDPNTGSQTDVRFNLGYNIFCSGFAHLMNGSLFIAGGTKDQQLSGIVKTTYFNPDTSQWSQGPNMATGRWYPTVTALNNGEQLITSGGPSTPEVRQNDGTLRSLSNASLGLPLYPWFDVAPNGRAFYSGPDQTLRSLDPSGTGSWQTYQQRDGIDRSYGGHALFDIGKELVAGGGPSTTSAEVIDANGATPQVSATSPMAFGRRQHNLTVLADGSVLATGGNSSGAGLVDMNAGVYPGELWNPATGSWKTLAAMAVTRQYHSTALLLPDGRVLSAGGGICGTCDQVGYLAKNAEVFTPPYLFQKDGTGQLAPRPTISSAPSSAGYGSQIQISTPDAASIQKVALVRLGAVTHSVNMEQRYVPLNFSRGSGSLTASIPASVNVAPPGFYMLFIIDSAGVPSVSKMVQLAPNQRPVAAATATPTSGAAPLTVAFDGTGSHDPDAGDSLTYSWDLDGDGQYNDSSSPTPSYTYTASGTYNASLRVTDPQGASDTAAVTISVGNTSPTATITAPSPTLTWAVGDRIDFAGSATDKEDGTLPDSALSWSIVLHHCPSTCDVHDIQSFPGVSGGSFQAPDGDYPSYLELRLTATDSQGLTDTRSLRLDPKTVTLNFKSSPDGLELAVDGASATAPFARTVIAGSTNRISASSPQTAQGKTWTFKSWSDGGSQTHDIAATSDATYTASYESNTSSQCGGGLGASLVLLTLCGGPYLRRRITTRQQ